MSIQTKVGAGVITLCALYASSIMADAVVTETRTDTTTQGSWMGNYGSCYNVLPQASPRTCVPEVEIGPDFEGDVPTQYLNVVNEQCEPTDPEFSDAVCIKGDAPENFDVRIFVNNPEVGHAYAWGFTEYGTGGDHDVLDGTSQDNACQNDLPEGVHSPDANYASTFDSDDFDFDPLSGEIKIIEGGDATIAYYFLTEANVCRSQSYELFVNDVSVASGKVIDFSSGKYVVFDIEGIPDDALVRLDTENLALDDPERVCGVAPQEALNSHLSGIFVDGTQACAVPDGDGCTPGFWKNTRKHINAWVGYAPGDLFSSVFEDAFPGMTLKQVLKQGGGGLKALGRHTVAALLNGANSDISYGMTDAEVIAAFNAVYPGTKKEYTTLKNEFAYDNERGCPINGKTAPE